MQISFNVVCANDGKGKSHSTMFANALQDRYALKKVNNSASLGVGVLGSVSMPIGSTDDSMVKVASETVSAPKFYERYFALVDVFLPQEVKKTEHIPEQPKAELGVPGTQSCPGSGEGASAEGRTCSAGRLDAGYTGTGACADRPAGRTEPCAGTGTCANHAGPAAADRGDSAPADARAVSQTATGLVLSTLIP
jgi:hypothetical protein